MSYINKSILSFAFIATTEFVMGVLVGSVIDIVFMEFYKKIINDNKTKSKTTNVSSVLSALVNSSSQIDEDNLYILGILYIIEIFLIFLLMGIHESLFPNTLGFKIGLLYSQIFLYDYAKQKFMSLVYDKHEGNHTGTVVGKLITDNTSLVQNKNNNKQKNQ